MVWSVEAVHGLRLGILREWPGGVNLLLSIGIYSCVAFLDVTHPTSKLSNNICERILCIILIQRSLIWFSAAKYIE